MWGVISIMLGSALLAENGVNHPAAIAGALFNLWGVICFFLALKTVADRGKPLTVKDLEDNCMYDVVSWPIEVEYNDEKHYLVLLRSLYGVRFYRLPFRVCESFLHKKNGQIEHRSHKVLA